jgi:hypothetical protein
MLDLFIGTAVCGFVLLMPIMALTICHIVEYLKEKNHGQ